MTSYNSDFIYIGTAMKATDPPDMVLAYEKPEIHDGDGMLVLYNDGHVDWVGGPMRHLQAIVAELKAGQNPPPSLGQDSPSTPPTGK